jgi:hypothetical protein
MIKRIADLVIVIFIGNNCLLFAHRSNYVDNLPSKVIN